MQRANAVTPGTSVERRARLIRNARLQYVQIIAEWKQSLLAKGSDYRCLFQRYNGRVPMMQSPFDKKAKSTRK
jgi:hypothetical protein